MWKDSTLRELLFDYMIADTSKINLVRVRTCSSDDEMENFINSNLQSGWMIVDIRTLGKDSIIVTLGRLK